MDSFISWVGGKKALRRTILEQFPAEYGRYIEVFGGAGWILFAEGRKVKLEVYNDAEGSLVNLFRCVKYHPEALQKELEWILNSREQFFDAREDARGLTDIQRAARFFILIKESFGTDCQSFGVRAKDLSRAAQYLQEVSKRLRMVVIEHQDFERILKTYDRPDALFYLDPPYFNAEKYYSVGFGKEDHTRLHDALRGVKGRFILSYNDCEEARELYKDYHIISTSRNDSLVTKTASRRYKELIIKNY
ncbi:MAG: DNA adenine methylase [Lachnospiraceae bacterium]|nr:DNA adenine methylase [Lachnospiraceae bacterium]